MRTSCLTALLTGLLSSFLPAQHTFVLTDGTSLRVRLNRNISSADAKVGDRVDFDVVDDVLVNGLVVIQRGSSVLATVTEVEQKGLMGKSGKLNVTLDHARSVLGGKIPLRAVKENDRSATNLGTLATSIVSTLLFMKGKDVTIPKGTEVTAYVHGDIRLDETQIRAHATNTPGAGAKESAPAPAAPVVTTPAPTQSAPASPSSSPPQSPPSPAPRAATPAPAAGMTNADVLALKKAGFSDDLIISKIKISKCSFRLETNDLIDLKTAGLSDRVIAVMVDKAQ